jgi:uncharacterized protein (TIGR00725 family)
MLRIGVIGSSAAIPSDVKEVAFQVGKFIAKAGAVLITGGRGGVMAAACEGAKSEKGITIGILPEATLEYMNPFVDIPITTGIGFARNFINISSSDALISIRGAGGTLSEIGYAIALKKLLILIENTGGVTQIIAKNIDQIDNSHIKIADSAQKAVDIAVNEIS